MRDRSYFYWLIDTYVSRKDRRRHHPRYSCLLDQMYRKEYYFVVPMDENRAGDGLYLRDTYLMNQPNPVGSVSGGPCSFLEFLIGVALRLEYMLMDENCVPASEYFWELADRLRLTDYPDVAYSDDSTGLMVDLIMTDFMDRTYSRCGEGGLFPLRPPCKDQTKVEVWYQLNAYVNEHNGFFDR